MGYRHCYLCGESLIFKVKYIIFNGNPICYYCIKKHTEWMQSIVSQMENIYGAIPMSNQ